MRALFHFFFFFFLCLRLNYTSQEQFLIAAVTAWVPTGIFVLSSSVGLTRPVENWNLALKKNSSNKYLFCSWNFYCLNLLANDSEVIGLLGAPFSHSPGWELDTVLLWDEFHPFSAPWAFHCCFYCFRLMWSSGSWRWCSVNCPVQEHFQISKQEIQVHPKGLLRLNTEGKMDTWEGCRKPQALAVVPL